MFASNAIHSKWLRISTTYVYHSISIDQKTVTSKHRKWWTKLFVILQKLHIKCQYGWNMCFFKIKFCIDSKIFDKENIRLKLPLKYIFVCWIVNSYCEFNNGKLFFSHCSNMDLAKSIAILNMLFTTYRFFSLAARQKIYRIGGFVFRVNSVILHEIITGKKVTDLSVVSRLAHFHWTNKLSSMLKRSWNLKG